MKATLFLLGALLAPSMASACEYDLPNKSKIQGSRVVFVGQVSSVKVVPTTLLSTAEVHALEALKGSAPASATSVVGCLPPLRPGQRVVVAIRNGQAYVYPARDYEAQFKYALAR